MNKVSKPTFLESLIPIWGSGKCAINAYQEGNKLNCAINSLIAISDIFLIKALYKDIGIVGAKVVGLAIEKKAINFAVVRSLFIKGALTDKHLHHWLIRQGGKGKNLHPVLLHGPWNLIRISRSKHILLHSKRLPLWRRMIIGNPIWLKLSVISGTGKLVKKDIRSKNMKIKLGNPQTAWDIYLNNKWIDTVYYDKDCDKEYVKRSLVEHDGFSPFIELKERK